MIEASKWGELLKEWKTVGKVYQVPERSEKRLRHFCKHCLEPLKGKG